MIRPKYLSGSLAVLIGLYLLIASCNKDSQNLPPEASFTVTPPITVVDTTVIFDASESTDDYTSSEILEYRWDFNNDGLWETDWSNDPIVSRQYQAVGYYTIGLEVMDQAGYTSWVARNLLVVDSTEILDEIPTPRFSVSPATGEINTLFTFDASGCTDLQDTVTLLQVRWDFDSNGSWDSDWSTEKVVTHKYGEEGQYEVVMQVRDLDGNINGDSKDIIVGSGGSGVIELTFIDITGGTFEMGCTQSNTETCNTYDETPIRTVTINAFQLSKYEITNQQFADFLNAVGCSPNGTLGGETLIFIGAENCKITYSGGSFSAVYGNYNYPVVQVTWLGAMEFCDHYGGRLPTEAEWEYAAKGGNSAGNYTYAGSDNISNVAWYAANTYAVNHDVGNKEPNQLGLYDMSGNASEWCFDWYAWDYYTLDDNDNPLGPQTGEERIIRGGSVYNGDDDCRSSDRFYVLPKTSLPGLGFRMAK